jgi:hypothetical protein
MDPTSASAAATVATELWKVGGIAAVLLAIIVVGGYLMFRFLIGMIKELGERLSDVQDYQRDHLEKVVQDNTASNHAVVVACDNLRTAQGQVFDALRVRPCLIETEKLPAVRTPIPTSKPMAAMILLALVSMTGCGRSEADLRRDQFAAQAAADIDAHAQAAALGSPLVDRVADIRRLCAALAGSFGYRIDATAAPVYPLVEAP